MALMMFSPLPHRPNSTRNVSMLAGPMGSESLPSRTANSPSSSSMMLVFMALAIGRKNSTSTGACSVLWAVSTRRRMTPAAVFGSLHHGRAERGRSRRGRRRAARAAIRRRRRRAGTTQVIKGVVEFFAQPGRIGAGLQGEAEAVLAPLACNRGCRRRNSARSAASSGWMRQPASGFGGQVAEGGHVALGGQRHASKSPSAASAQPRMPPPRVAGHGTERPRGRVFHLPAKLLPTVGHRVADGRLGHVQGKRLVELDVLLSLPARAW